MTELEFEMKVIEILRSAEDPQKALEVAIDAFNKFMAEE